MRHPRLPTLDMVDRIDMTAKLHAINHYARVLVTEWTLRAFLNGPSLEMRKKEDEVLGWLDARDVSWSDNDLENLLLSDPALSHFLGIQPDSPSGGAWSPLFDEIFSKRNILRCLTDRGPSTIFEVLQLLKNGTCNADNDDKKSLHPESLDGEIIGGQLVLSTHPTPDSSLSAMTANQESLCYMQCDTIIAECYPFPGGISRSLASARLAAVQIITRSGSKAKYCKHILRVLHFSCD